MKLRLPFRKLARDAKGVTTVEFALISPVLFTFIFGIMDVSYNIYAKSRLEGEMQRAARKSSLESGMDVSNQAVLDEEVRARFLTIVAPATVTFSRVWYMNYNIAEKRKEDFTDNNGDGTCNAGEPFEDANRNGSWDTDASAAGSGGAKDAVLYTATATYPRAFPLAQLIGLSPNVTITSSTILRNQPFSQQMEPLAGNCV